MALPVGLEPMKLIYGSDTKQTITPQTACINIKSDYLYKEFDEKAESSNI